MGGKATFLRVGLLVVFGLASAVGVVLFLGRNQVRDGQRYETYFGESVQGLDIGAPVKFRGVNLGQVTEIALVSAVYPDAMPANDTRLSYQLVIVRYAIDPKRLGAVPAPADAVAQGLRARLAAQGLTGLAYLELDFVNAQRFPATQVPWTPATFYIPSMPSTVSQVQDAVTTVLDRLRGVDYERLVASLQKTLDTLNTELTSGNAHTILADTAAITTNLRTTLEQAHLDETAADLRATAAALRRLSQGPDTQALVARATQAIDQLAEASRRLPALFSTLQSGIRRADDGIGDITSTLAPLLRDARNAAANLRDTADALRRYPAATLLGAPPPRESAGK